MNGGFYHPIPKGGGPSFIHHSCRAFTLIELMLVMAIMGLLGTISIGGFRAMRRGMEQSAVMRNVDQFIHNAYQRAQIDRQPTVVYFWNETRRAESDTESILVVGRAVAVRRAGRISLVKGNYLIDEFGDLRYSAGTDEDGKEEQGGSQATDQGAMTMRLYRMNGDESGGRSENCSIVSQTTVNMDEDMNISQMMTDPDWVNNIADRQVRAYGWYTDDASNWKAGYAYGFEFAEITLPNNYVFGTEISDKTDDPVRECGKVVRCSPGSAEGNVTVCNVRSDGGDPKAVDFKNNTTQNADADLDNVKY